MHAEAMHFVAYIARCIPQPRKRVLEIGSRNINGSVRGLFAGSEYIGSDIAPGPGVDVVYDGGTVRDWPPFDTIVTTETLEHTAKAEAICRAAWKQLVPGGLFIVTAAGEGRRPHSAVDGCELREGEYYGNVTVSQLRVWLSDYSFALIDTGNPGDIYALAVR